MGEETRKSEIVKINQVKKGFQIIIAVIDKNGNTREQTIREQLLSPKLKSELTKKGTALVNREVVYKYRDGEIGSVFLADEPDAPKVTPSTPRATSSTTSTGASHSPQNSTANEVFENPYNFIPAPVRATDHPELGDHPPKGHQAYFPGTWSGKIEVRLTAVTPLLVPEAASADVDRAGHRILEPAVDQNGLPIIPPTSLKGMLRAAYEAVTNSRMGVFTGHDERLAFRSQVRDSSDFVPFRVSNDGQYLEFYRGSTPNGRSGNDPMYAAWIPRYKRLSGILQEGAQLAEHGQHAWAELELWRHQRGFTFWRVIALRDSQDPSPSQFHRPSQPGDRAGPVSGTSHRWVEGYVVVTEQNIRNKHDERFFFCQNPPARIPIQSDHCQLWSELVENYQETHRQEIQRGQTGPSSMSGTAWSRHITGGPAETKLQKGTFGYAKLDSANRVVALYPVMISRQLFPNSPAALLHPSLKPAQKLARLSPAERVFGWVSQDGKGSWRGALRLGTVQCQSQLPDAIENFSSPVALAILGAPKPEQVQFYLARDQNGTPLSHKKAQGYQNGQALRGRKVYPHQPLTEEKSYWDPQATSDLQNGATQFYREYLRVGSTKDSQNRSIKGWIKPSAQFEFSVEVENLSSCELGALLWLLNLEGPLYHRFGGGKPLGFGSVKLEVIGLELADGEAIRDDYLNWSGGSSGRRWGSFEQAQPAIAEFQSAVSQAYGSDFEAVPFIKAFLNAARGSSLPFHYPRPERIPSSQPENFRWFMANEKAQEPLPALTRDERGLPYQSR